MIQAVKKSLQQAPDGFVISAFSTGTTPHPQVQRAPLPFPLLCPHLCKDNEKINTTGTDKHSCPGYTGCTNDDLGAIRPLMCQPDSPSITTLITRILCPKSTASPLASI